ncbi:MAG: CHRD domain-containing protein [Chloroflexi bacterium]|nr:CHRD domain-containing protein [Chloroflexota bacterium]
MRDVALALLAAVALLLATAGLSHWSATAEPNPVLFRANLDGEQASVPSSTATGTALVTLDTETSVLAWNLSWSGFSSDVIAIHFHGPAEPGTDAIVRVELDVISGLESPSVGETTVSEAQKAEILAELWYINIHTDDSGGGEIRGQVVRAEVQPTPEPTPTPQRLLGDVNCSGEVDSIDATLVLQFGAGLLSSLRCEENADVNADQAIDSLDALDILFLVAGFVDSLPIR